MALALRRIALTKKPLLLIMVVLYVVAVGCWIAPMFSADFADKVQTIQGVPRFVPSTVTYNFLLVADIGTTSNGLVYQPRVRFDNLILFTGIWLIGTLTLTVLNTQATAFKVGALEVHTESEEAAEASVTDSDVGLPKEPANAETFLVEDVANSLARANQLNFRSLLMLAGGIIMAFVGIGIFYATFPQFSTGEDRWTYLERGIRPTGMLVFVEGIAWFLLRQSRALIEDYKAFQAFHRLYLKRANYLVALTMLSLKEVSPAQMFWAASVLSEDLRGKLAAGETTENLEGIKAIEPNPVFALFQSLVESVRKK